MAGNLKLDTNHDIIIGRGATRVGGVDQVAQLVKCRLLALLGEWKLDPNLGIPWFESVFTKNTRISDVQATVANIIRSTNGVQQLISIDINPDFRERSLSISFVAISDYGNIKDFVTWQQYTV